jgi:hypothetical protein
VAKHGGRLRVSQPDKPVELSHDKRVTIAGVIKRSLQFKTEPAKFLVVFVKNKGAPILTPVE